ncbi:hypothetical protein ACNY9Y_003426 [Cronobacter dublinensis]
MSVQNTPSSAAGNAPARDTTGSVYASLFDKINLDARYIGLTLPRVLGRLPYGPDRRTSTASGRCLTSG